MHSEQPDFQPITNPGGGSISTGHDVSAAGTSRRCSVCILPSEYPRIEFDNSGQCVYCQRWNDKWSRLDFARQSVQLESVLGQYRGKSSPYDCLIGLSGGKDSVYAAYLLKKHGMRPLACTFNNGFLTEAALHNIRHAVDALSIGHVFVEPPAAELGRLYRHFMVTAGEFCSVCNVGIRSSLYRIAKCYGIKLIVSGQSNRTEANSPREYFTCSPGYFKNVVGSVLSAAGLNGFMYMSQLKRVAWHLTRSAVFLELPSYVPWKEEEFKQELADKVGWKGAVGEQHSDCRMSDAKEYLKLKKFGVTELTAKLSSLVRDGQLTREDALLRIRRQVDCLLANESVIRDTMKRAFDLSEDQIDGAIRASHLPYIARTDVLISDVRNLHERFRYKKRKA